MGMAIIFSTARRSIPARKPLVISKRAPISKGARKPPTSAIQRKIPLAEPRYSEGIPELSIRMSKRIGVKADPAKPRMTNDEN